MRDRGSRAPRRTRRKIKPKKTHKKTPRAHKNTPKPHQNTHPLREWPYEHIIPGLPRNAEPYGGGRQVGHRRREREAEERQQRIADAMARMPTMIAAYRASRRVPWEEVSAADRLLMSARQIREKYVLRKLK